MNKWEALKNQLEKIGRGERIYAGHILMIMDELEVNSNWDLQKDGFIVHGENNNSKEVK